MTSPNDNHDQRSLTREWAAARIVVIGGFVVAVLVAGFFAYRAHEEHAAAIQAALPKKVDAKALAQAELAVCTAELIAAEGIGIVPNYAGLASPRLARGDAPHRYICEAKTHLTTYFIAADLLCNALRDPRCVSVFRVASIDGRLLYARRE